ncbi:tRNA-uridine aminocarboxypropyltransferase 1 isoform X3 [Bos indicus]|uniref:tRNA-uridine aminocarboxypropyltransferase 1 n=1 Tax=Bos indicus TaxID=9915 RepID=A0ABM4T0Y8_BOSIN
MSLNTPVFLKEREEDTSKFVEIQQSQTTCIAAEDPLQNLCLASQDVLKNAQQNGRSKCLKCGGSRMFYCYTCYVPVENVPVEQIPHVKLPLKIDIIKHPNETDGKSTAVHAKLLAPEFVNIYTYPCIPEYEEKDHEVALVFPGPKSVSVKDISFHLQKKSQNSIRGKNDDLDKPSIKRKKTEEPDLNDSKCKDTTLKKIVFIDSTWNQTNKIFTDERLQVVMFGCESWTIKKTECQRIDAFELWCWRLLRFPWTARRSKQSILIIILIIKEINPEYALELLILKLKFQYLGHLMRRADLLGCYKLS